MALELELEAISPCMQIHMPKAFGGIMQSVVSLASSTQTCKNLVAFRASCLKLGLEGIPLLLEQLEASEGS